jgi:hypothetical protein
VVVVNTWEEYERKVLVSACGTDPLHREVPFTLYEAAALLRRNKRRTIVGRLLFLRTEPDATVVAPWTCGGTAFASDKEAMRRHR